jgi:hypothetical protein
VSEARIETRQATVGRSDLSGLLEHVGPEIELHPLVSVRQRTCRRHAGIEQWSEHVRDLWRKFGVAAESFPDLDYGTPLARIHWRGRPSEGSPEIGRPAAAAVRFEGDKVVSVGVHLDEERALASVPS